MELRPIVREASSIKSEVEPLWLVKMSFSRSEKWAIGFGSRHPQSPQARNNYKAGSTRDFCKSVKYCQIL